MEYEIHSGNGFFCARVQCKVLEFESVLTYRSRGSIKTLEFKQKFEQKL